MILIIRNLSRWFVQKAHRFLDSYLETSGVFLNKEDEALIEDIVRGRQNGITMDEQEFADLHERLKHLTVDENGVSSFESLLGSAATTQQEKGVETRSCDLTDESILKTCLNEFYARFNSEMVAQVDSIVTKYIETPTQLVKKLEKKYEASLFDFCPAKVVESADSIPPRLSAWETDKQIYISATVMIAIFAIVLFLTVPLQNNPKLAGQLDILFLVTLAFGAMNMSPSSTLLNASVLCFGGSYVSWIVVRKGSSDLEDSANKRTMRRRPRKDWFNY